MKRTYEVYEDGAGFLHLAILESGKCREILTGWGDYGVAGRMISDISALIIDPDACESWTAYRASEALEDGQTMDDAYTELTDADPWDAQRVAWVDVSGRITIDYDALGYSAAYALGVVCD